MVEAHGAGTPLADSIEYGAITSAMREHTDKKQFCAFGSVKANIGHTGAAAGMASLLKVLLSLKHRKIPPCLHSQKDNSVVDFDSSPFYVNTELLGWPIEVGQKRRAAINSFGSSGTNAHLVIEAFKKVRTAYRLLIVGDAPYAHDYIDDLKARARGDRARHAPAGRQRDQDG